jgi:hypothetical protein
LANPKIKAAIVDVQGAVELLLSTGFELEKQEGESVLIYPADCPGPDWLDKPHYNSWKLYREQKLVP